MYKFSKYKEQYKANLKLAIPVILSQLGQVIVQLADNTMVGQYGGEDATPLAAAAFGGGIFFLSFIAVMGLTFGMTPLVGELFAQGRHGKPAKYLQNGICLYLFAAVAISILQFALIPVMWYMGQPEEVVAMAIPYYKTLTWSLTPMIVFFTFKQFLEGIGNTKAAMYIVIISNIINIGLNYLLIGGELGAPELGTLGAGIATLISRIVLALLIVLYFLYSTQFKLYRERFSRYNFDMVYIKRLFNLGVPIASQIFFEASSFVVIGFLFGLFGTNAISANQIAITMGNCSFMIIIAVSSATTIRISHCYGLRDVAQMKLASKAGWHLGVLWNLLTAIFFFALSSKLPLLFTSNPEVVKLASILLISVAIFQIPDGIQCVAVGILRGMQDMKIIPVVSFVAYWLGNIPIAYMCAFHLNMDAEGLYMGFFFGLTLASVLLYWRIKWGQKRLIHNFR